VIRGRTARLNDKHILPADVFVDFDERLTIGKGGHLDVGERLTEVVCNSLGERTMGGSTDDFHELIGPVLRRTDS
jgi:hypothetical protein